MAEVTDDTTIELASDGLINITMVGTGFGKTWTKSQAGTYTINGRIIKMNNEVTLILAGNTINANGVIYTKTN